MRFKLNISKYDDHRILVYDKKGLSENAVNAINELCKKEHWNDVAFATLDDDRIGFM